MLVDDLPVEVQVLQPRRGILAISYYSATRLKAAHKKYLNSGVSRALDLGTDTRELFKLAKSIGKTYGELVQAGAGRLLKAPTLWEDAAKTLFTTNCSWSLTKLMARSACSADFSAATVSGGFPFPVPEVVARSREIRIKQKMRVGYRAKYLKMLAKRFCRDTRLVDIGNLDAEQLRTLFSSLPGFGPYATNHMMILSGYFDQIPVDSVVKTYLKRFNMTDEPAELIDHYYGKWGEYKWWGMKLETMINHANWLGD